MHPREMSLIDKVLDGTRGTAVPGERPYEIKVVIGSIELGTVWNRRPWLLFQANPDQAIAFNATVRRHACPGGDRTARDR